MRWVSKHIPQAPGLVGGGRRIFFIAAMVFCAVAGCSTTEKRAAIVLDENGQPLEAISAWPSRGEHPQAYPEGTNAEQLLNERYARASKTPMGTSADKAAIKKLIVANIRGKGATVGGIRWFSPTLAMAQAGWYPRPLGPADYYYVLRKQEGTWEILTYYMLRGPQAGN